MQKLRSLHTLAVASVTVLIASYAFSQSPAMQQKLASLKESAAQNKQKLMHYEWTETQQLTLKGEPKGTKQYLCRYSSSGQVQKTPIGAQEPEAEQGGRRSGGRLKERIVEKKKEEMQDYMGDVKSILALYMPPDPQKMQRAFQEKNVSFTPGNGTVDIVFRNYAQPGDQMTVTFNEAERKISHIDVNTYTQSPDQVVTLAVQFAALADGTNYAQQTVMNAKAKQLLVTTTNSNYQKLAN